MGKRKIVFSSAASRKKKMIAFRRERAIKMMKEGVPTVPRHNRKIYKMKEYYTTIKKGGQDKVLVKARRMFAYRKSDTKRVKASDVDYVGDLDLDSYLEEDKYLQEENEKEREFQFLRALDGLIQDLDPPVDPDVSNHIAENDRLDVEGIDPHVSNHIKENDCLDVEDIGHGRVEHLTEEQLENTASASVSSPSDAGSIEECHILSQEEEFVVAKELRDMMAKAQVNFEATHMKKVKLEVKRKAAEDGLDEFFVSKVLRDLQEDPSLLYYVSDSDQLASFLERLSLTQEKNLVSETQIGKTDAEKENQIILKYGFVHLKISDEKCFAPKTFFTPEIIDFCRLVTWKDTLDDYMRGVTVFADYRFMDMLCNEKYEQAHKILEERVKGGFAKKHLIVIQARREKHWFLIIVNLRLSFIAIMDSDKASENSIDLHNHCSKNIRAFLEREKMFYLPNKMHTVVCNVPQQTHGKDGGPFCCLFLRTCFRSSENFNKLFNLSIIQGDIRKSLFSVPEELDPLWMRRFIQESVRYQINISQGNPSCSIP